MINDNLIWDIFELCTPHAERFYNLCGHKKSTV